MKNTLILEENKNQKSQLHSTPSSGWEGIITSYLMPDTLAILHRKKNLTHMYGDMGDSNRFSDLLKEHSE